MNANDYLKGYNCSDNFYKHPFGLMFTDGVRALCEQYQCYWFIDVVVSYQHELKGEEFQVWRLFKFEDDSAKVTCTDGNNRVLKEQAIDFTDFNAQEATVWVEGSVVLLSSEH